MKPTSAIPPEYFPESVQYLITVIGLHSALILVKNKGGAHIEIPKRARERHWLADLIGMDDFNKLALAYGSTMLEIPRCANLLRLARNIKMLQDKRAGATNSQLALKFQMTERRIRSTLRIIEKVEQQAWINEVQAELSAIL